jgi:hypothetical protein
MKAPRTSTRVLPRVSPTALPLALALLAACAGEAPDRLAPEARTPDAAPAPDASPQGADGGSITTPPPPADAGAAATFPPGVGVGTATERTAPCSAAEEGSFRNAPEDPDVVQACLPNYRVWAPVVCGGPKPACACDATKCAPKEVAKQVSGSFCVCLSPCASQAQGATCGEGSRRRCIPVDDVNRKQVFVCGGAR